MVMFGLCLGLLITGCGGSKSTQDTSTTAAPRKAEGTERPRRTGTIACHLHSCSPPYYCNQESGVCEMLPCKTKKDCPYDYKCDFSRNVCR